MTTSAQLQETQLARCNQELADILGQPPLELPTGGASLPVFCAIKAAMQAISDG